MDLADSSDDSLGTTEESRSSEDSGFIGIKSQGKLGKFKMDKFFPKQEQIKNVTDKKTLHVDKKLKKQLTVKLTNENKLVDEVRQKYKMEQSVLEQDTKRNMQVDGTAVLEDLFDKELLKQLKYEEKLIIEQQKKEHLALRQEEKRKKEEEKEHQLQEKLRLKEEKEHQLQEKIRLKEEKLHQKQERQELLVQMKLEKREKKRVHAEQRHNLFVQKKEEKKRIEEEQKNARKEKALKGMKYLLGVSEKYSTFFQEKVEPKVNTKGVLKERNKYQPTKKDMKAAASEQNTVKEKECIDPIDISKKLKYFKNGSLRPYQLDGVTWMSVLFDNGLNGILADEMGLGKTVQVIALICHLVERNILGPFLIVTPLSTIPNWQSEFERFAPDIPVVVFPGDEATRQVAKPKILQKYVVGNKHTRPVVITTYGVPLRESRFLEQFTWQYIIVDEGHRIKNHKSRLSITLRNLNSSNRLLLTGTPLQNNITELWALLNFLLPHIFQNMDTFGTLFMMEDIQDKDKIIENEESHNLISTIHKVLGPFMLRRLKSDVLTEMVPKKDVIISCPMSMVQKDLYRYVIEHNISKLRGEIEEEEIDINSPRKKRKCTQNKKYYISDIDDDDLSDFEDEILDKAKEIANINMTKKEKKEFITRLTMTNPTMMFKKIVDHPYLINFPLDPNSKEKKLLVDENLINTSGKMIVLQSMLRKLKQNGHKVLLFSTLVIMLDMIEEMLIMRNINYLRLDGSYSLEERQKCISEFNDNPDCFLFLVSTRVGGLGLNLTAADTVIFFDRDWNPQVDIQAQDRCHRIGQTRPVVVYTLVLRNTIDEHIIATGNIKRRLERIVITDGKFKKLVPSEKGKAENDLIELKKLLSKEEEIQNMGEFSESELDLLLDRSDLYEQMKAKENQPC